MLRNASAEPTATIITDELDDAAGRQIEGWVAGALGAKEATRGGVTLDRWELGLRAPTVAPNAPEKGNAVPGTGWERFKQVNKGDVTVLRLLDRNLLREGELRELADDLICLVEAGHTRIIINCAGIERLSSWVVGAVAAAHRKCVAADNGAVRVCGLRPEVAAAFSILGGAKGVALFTDEASALEAPWPPHSRPRALPVSVLSAFTAGELVVPRVAATPEPIPEIPSTDMKNPAVRLVAQGGKSDGKAIKVGVDGLRIGRDATCDVRLASAGVSRFHAALVRHDGKLFALDLGSTNGTFLNGKKLGVDSVELNDGDRLKIGPLKLVVVFGVDETEPSRLDDSVAEWLLDGATPATTSTSMATSEDLPSFEAIDPQRIVRCEVIEGVTVIAPRASDLEDESTLGPLRAGFQLLIEPPVPTRVVVNLECVQRLSEQAIGLLVAHHFRLHRAGGALRVAAVPVRLMTRLEQIRLPELISCFATVDDAVLQAWPDAVDG